MSEPILQCTGLTKIYPLNRGWMAPAGEIRAVENVSISVEPGDVLAIVGESGSGKTTLAHMLLGLVNPTKGTIALHGKPVADVGRLVRSRQIQPVFQDPYASLNPRKTVAQIVGVPLAIHGMGSASERRKRVEEMVGLVGLPKRVMHSYPGQLSGGQRQRVAIARALVLNPDILICDEPTSALDVSVQAQILNLLATLRREFGLTYVLISHDLGVVRHMADHIVVMYRGNVVEAGPPDQIFDRPAHPYTRMLLDSMPTPDPDLGVPLTQFADDADEDVALDERGCVFRQRCPKAMEICSTEPGEYSCGDGKVKCHLYGDSDRQAEGKINEALL